MIKLIQALLSGIFITFILDFFIFLGVWLNYIRIYKIDIYFNELFLLNQNIFLYVAGIIVYGYFATYLTNKKILLFISAVSFGTVLLTLIQPIGNDIGHLLFAKQDQRITVGKYEYFGDILYTTKLHTYIYDDDKGKVIRLNNNNLSTQN